MTTLQSRADSSSYGDDHNLNANAYRLYLAVDSCDGVVDGAMDQLGSWLRRRKKWDPPLDKSSFVSDEGRVLVTLHRQSAEGSDFRARLTEPGDLGVWRTELTVHEQRDGRGWIALQVTNSEGRFVDVPWIAQDLIQALPTLDGDTLVSVEPRLIAPAGVDELLDEICDPQRRGLYIVAGTADDGIDLGVFHQQVGRWTQQVRGLAKVAVLTPDATDVVREALDEDHRVHPWTLRTFYPDVDPAISSDGLRHRWLTRDRLASEPDEAIRKLLGRIVRRHSSLRTPPEGYQRVDRALRRLEDKLLIDQITGHLEELDGRYVAVAEPQVQTVIDDAPPIDAGLDAAVALEPAEVPAIDVDTAGLASQVEDYLALIEMVKGTLGLDELTAESVASVASDARQSKVVAESIERLSEQLRERQERLDDLQDEVAAYTSEIDELRIDERIAAEDAARLADENRFLKQRLAETGAADAYAPVPVDAMTVYPPDFGELYDRRDELAVLGVVLTADPDEMRAIDEHDTLGKIVTTAWDCLLTLADYLRARSDGVCTSNVKQYLREIPQGYRGVPPKKFAENETGATMDGWGGERSFPVPVEAHPSGSMTMTAHFKLGTLGRVSPRMHYVDCTGTTGKVYVGYIGSHLRNTKT